MYSREDFLKEQVVLSKLFSNGIKSSRLSHAYLLYGENSSPLLDSALFIAKSLSCKKGGLACDECDSCIRFNKGVHPDFMLIDGEEKIIRKSNIEELSHFFSMSTAEVNHISTYVINHIENSTSEAVNALLKTLEEPSGNTVAILTTDNRSKVLPTIVSRCQLVPIFKPDIIQKVNSYKGEFDRRAYYLVSLMVYSEERKNEILDSKEFNSAYEVCLDYLDALIRKNEDPNYILIRGGDYLKSNKCYNYFYSILSTIFTSCLLDKKDGILDVYTNGLIPYKKYLDKAVALLDEAKAKSSANMNFTFTLSCLALIMEGK